MQMADCCQRRLGCDIDLESDRHPEPGFYCQGRYVYRCNGGICAIHISFPSIIGLFLIAAIIAFVIHPDSVTYGQIRVSIESNTTHAIYDFRISDMYNWTRCGQLIDPPYPFDHSREFQLGAFEGWYLDDSGDCEFKREEGLLVYRMMILIVLLSPIPAYAIFLLIVHYIAERRWRIEAEMALAMLPMMALNPPAPLPPPLPPAPVVAAAAAAAVVPADNDKPDEDSSSESSGFLG